MRSFPSCLSKDTCVSKSQRYHLKGTDLVLHTRESIEHDCLVPSRNIVYAGLEKGGSQTKGNYDKQNSSGL